MCFICIYTLYNDVLSIFNLFSRGGLWNFLPKKGRVFKNFDAKKGGLWKVSKTPPRISFCVSHVTNFVTPPTSSDKFRSTPQKTSTPKQAAASLSSLQLNKEHSCHQAPDCIVREHPKPTEPPLPPGTRLHRPRTPMPNEPNLNICFPNARYRWSTVPLNTVKYSPIIQFWEFRKSHKSTCGECPKGHMFQNWKLYLLP